MKPASEHSYLAQVVRLRRMAEAALTKFPLNNYTLNFIHHGENATFKITTKNKSYLLRLHRNGYHTKPAILEELKWLRSLSDTTDISVQRPLQSKSGSYVEFQSGEQMPSRYCSVLEWQPGRMRFQSLTLKNFYDVGEITAHLHKSAAKRRVKHRHYWTADGLLGRKAKLGSIHDLREDLSGKDFSDVEKCRQMVYSKISNYQRRHPTRLSLIHADLHFGNMLWEKGKVLPIDFDDCGVGFHLMDLAVTICSSSRIFTGQDLKRAKACTFALLDGYCRVGDLSNDDLDCLPYFVLARKLAMVAWLSNRRDNPRLLRHFNQTIKSNIREFRRVLSNGPPPIL